MNAVAEQVELTEYQRQALEIAEGITRRTREVKDMVGDTPTALHFDADGFFAGAIKEGLQQLGPQVEEFEDVAGNVVVQFTFHDGTAIHFHGQQCHIGEYHVHVQEPEET